MADAATSAEDVPVLDPRTKKGRLLACSRCHEPVTLPGWSGVFRTRCGSCCFETERDVTLDREGEPPVAPLGLSFALGAFLPGRPAPAIDAAALRAACERRAPTPEALPALEWERVWIATWLAWERAAARDPLRARIALETALVATTIPAYRAFLLAHLAQHAASIGAPGLAKKWLKACPDVPLPEVDSEIRAARAFIALAEGRCSDVLHLAGGRVAGSGFTGHAVLTAIALAVEASERTGDQRWAEAILDEALAKKFLLAMAQVMDAFGLGVDTFPRWTRRVRRKTAIRSALWIPAVTVAGAVFWGVVRGELAFDVGRLLATGTLGGTVAGAADWLTFPWANGSRAKVAARVVLLVGAPLLVFFALAPWR